MYATSMGRRPSTSIRWNLAWALIRCGSAAATDAADDDDDAVAVADATSLELSSSSYHVTTPGQDQDF
jgi:hypothetical protein